MLPLEQLRPISPGTPIAEAHEAMGFIACANVLRFLKRRAELPR